MRVLAGGSRQVGMRTLAQLFAGIADAKTLAAHGARQVTGVHDDSRRVRDGGVFVTVPGATADGRRFIDDALRNGAAVVVGTGISGVPNVIVVPVEDARVALARLAQRWHGLDGAAARKLKLIAITGTNGKSTTAEMTRQILLEAGWGCGLLGTLHYNLCSRSVESRLTTPGPLELAEYLRACIDAGADAAVVEVSSHALAQQRTAGLEFSAAGFTNLTQDHLDYHGTMEDYRAAKARLFAGLGEDAVAVVNRDDPAHEAMIENCRARVVYYAMTQPADVTGSIVAETIAGTRYVLRIAGEELTLENRIVGRHNVYNALAAAGLATAVGVSPELIGAGLAAVQNVRGRLQRVAGMAGVDVLVDYAHTEDALRNVLGVLKPLTRGRLITVFGCGGDRDRDKRPKMARAVAEFSDAIVLTNDNPRGEDPRRIADDALGGLDESTRRRVIVELDRADAIKCALAAARDGDVVLIAGKGHERCQIIGEERIHFDDVEVAMAAAAELAGVQGTDR